MATCAVCHNDYDKSFQVILAGQYYDFDCFECAAHLLAPKCQHCSCTILGHGNEVDGMMFCCAHCARAVGESGVTDRATTVTSMGHAVGQ